MFVAEIGWSAATPNVIEVFDEWSLPDDVPRSGDQKSAALAASPLFPEGALLWVWEDYSRALAGRPSPDVLMSFRPVPFVTLGDAGSG